MNAVRPGWAAKARQGFDWAATRNTAHNDVTVHFTGITDALLAFIRDSEAVVGCVAWITNRDIVAALADRPVALIVNKEYALRSTDRKASSLRQRALLATLHGGLLRQDLPKPVRDIPSGSDHIDAVRCVGHIARGGGNTPLMHSKFIVRLRRGKPVAVWTGSFNFTVNAASNIENAVEIHDPVIAGAYLEEFARVAALSEPLEFKAGKADPNWDSARAARKPATKATADVPATTRTRAAKPASKATGRAHTGSAPTRVVRAGKRTTTTKKGRRR